MLKEDDIKIGEQLIKFKQYLDQNSRGILSARFGDGKSVFLNEFIDEYKKDYEFITIYPVNYQVADNKDIFEYIKHDILIRQLSIEWFGVKDSYDSVTTLCDYICKSPSEFIEGLLEAFSSINAPWGSIDFTRALKGLKGIRSGYKRLKESVNEKKAIDTFIKSFDNIKGSIYGIDPMSQLIAALNQRYKDKNDKKVVLLIEDLDRIDPAHIFRILNVFSAHFDNPEYGNSKDSNKFGFDKIITVCHFENIKSIFHHFYGENTDFSGYIGKFSTAIPVFFPYSLRDVLRDYLKPKIEAIIGSHYHLIAERLADLVIAKHSYNSKIKTNISEICNAINKEPKINEKIIKITDSIKISTKNNFARFLDLLLKLGIQFENLYELCTNNSEDLPYSDNNSKKQIDSLIGVCWLICVLKFRENISFNKENEIIFTSKQGYVFGQTLYITTKDESGIIKDILFHNSPLHTSFIFSEDEIKQMVSYLSEEA